MIIGDYRDPFPHSLLSIGELLWVGQDPETLWS